MLTLACKTPLAARSLHVRLTIPVTNSQSSCYLYCILSQFEACGTCGPCTCLRYLTLCGLCIPLLPGQLWILRTRPVASGVHALVCSQALPSNDSPQSILHFSRFGADFLLMANRGVEETYNIDSVLMSNKREDMVQGLQVRSLPRATS
jgi:hypothetical protein